MDPAVYKAAASGDVGFFRRSRDGGVSINDLLHQKTPKGNNVLHIAAEFKQIDFFKTLGQDHLFCELFWAANKKGETPLHIASRVGCSEVVEFLIEHAKAVPSIVDVESGVLLAEGEAHKQLLRRTNLQKDTAMHAAVRGAHPRVVTLLMAADPQLCCLTNSANESPLFLATRHRLSAIETPLPGATARSFLRIARSILNECPISPSFEGTNGVTALHAAVTCIAIGSRGLVKKMVSKHPAMMKKVDALGWTPLHYAALRGYTGATRLLLEADSSASYIYDKSGMSALHVAAFAGNIRVMKKMIHYRPDTCDVVNDKGQTVLHAAVLGGRARAVKYILKAREFSGLINEVDADGNTPLHLAVIYKCDDVVKILAHDPRVNKVALNNDFSLAVDTFLRGDDAFQQDADSLHSQRLGLGRVIGVPYFQEQILRGFSNVEHPENETFNAPSIRGGERQKAQSNSETTSSKRYETNLLVAVLIATVTFAGAFTVPGGFKNDGTPVLQDKPSFKVFLLFDTLSFFLSILVVFAHFHGANLFKKTRGARKGLIHYSIIGMTVAFASGIFAALPKGSLWLGVSVLIISGYICVAPTLAYYFVPSRRLRNSNWLRTRRI